MTRSWKLKLWFLVSLLITVKKNVRFFGTCSTKTANLTCVHTLHTLLYVILTAKKWKHVQSHLLTPTCHSPICSCAYGTSAFASFLPPESYVQILYRDKNNSQNLNACRDLAGTAKTKSYIFLFSHSPSVLTAKNWNPRLTLQILMNFYFLVLSCNDHKKTSMRTVTILTVKPAELHTFSSVSCLFKINVRR